MGEAYRGLTIQFKADGSRVMSEMKSMTRAASQVQSELRMVKKGLRFDGASTKLARAQVKLLGENAATARGSLDLMRREYKKLGEVRFNGVEMKELSARTKDASTQAETMRVRYSNVCRELATLHTQANEAWASCKKLSHLPNPLKEGWSEMSSEEIRSTIVFMERMGAVTSAESARMCSAVEKLRAEYSLTARELKTLDSIAQYQSFGNKIEQQAAQAKAAMKEMSAAAKAFRATGFEESIEEARLRVDHLEKEAKQLKAAMKLDPRSFALVAQHAEATRAKMVALKGSSEALKAEINSLSMSRGVREAAADMGKLEASLQKARAEVDSVGKEFVEAKSKLAVYKNELKNLTSAYAKSRTAEKQFEISNEIVDQNVKIREQARLVDQLASSYARAENNVQMYNKAVRLNETKGLLAQNEANLRALENQTSRRMKLLSSSAATALGMTMYSTLYPAVMMAGTYAIQAAEDVDAAYRNMRKTVQGTDEEFVQLKKSALEFGDTHYTSADQILEIEAIGGQLGITVDNLEAFSKTIANLNIATNVSDAEELATQFGKMASVMGLTSDEYDRFADSLVRLGNSEPAMESDILNMTTRFMGMGKVVGMSADQMLAWATAGVATGQKAEAAGSSMLRMTGRFEAAVAGVSDSMANLEDLSEEDLEAFEAAKDKLQGYADVARMTAEQFADLWKRDPSKALQAFVEGLHQMDKEGGSAVQALKDLGINNVRDQQLFLGLANTTKVLNESLKMSSNAWNGKSDEFGDAGDAAREADKKCQGFSGALQTMKNNGQHLASIMGESLTPTLRSITEIIQKLVGGFADLDPGMQQAITLSILGSAAMGPMLTAYGAVSNAVKGAKTSWQEYTTAGNRVARMENSRFATMTGMAKKYKENATQVGKLESRLEKMNKAIADPRVKKSPLLTGNVVKNMRETESSLWKMKTSMSAMSKVQAFSGLVGSVGQMAAIGAVLVGLEQVGAYLYDVKQKSDDYKKSTEGLSDATTRLRQAAAWAGSDIKEQAAAMNTSSYQQGMYFDRLQNTIKANADLADTIDSKLNKAFDDSTMAEFYAGKIAELQGSCEGSASKLAELQAYIDSYNQLTGSSVSMVNDFTGAVNMSNEALEKQKEMFIQNALMQAYADSLKEAAKTLANAQAEVAKTDNELNAVYAEAESRFGITKERFDELATSYRNSVNDGAEAQAQFVNGLKASKPGLLEFLEKNWELVAVQEENRKAEANAQLAVDQATKALSKQTSVANDAKKAFDDYNKNFGSIASYNEALNNNKLQDDVSFEEMANAMGIYDEEVKQLGLDMANLGIDAQQLGQIGTTAFMDLWNRAVEAGGGLDEVAKAVNLVNSTNIDPKDVIIEDGQLKVATQDLENFDAKELTSKGYTVDDQGTVTVETGKVDQLVEDINKLDGMTATSTLKADDQASAVVNDVINKILNASTLVATMSFKSDTAGATSDLNNLDKTAQAATKDRSIDVSVKSASAENALASLDRYRIQPKYIDVYVNQHGSIPTGGGAATGGVSRIPLNIPRNASGGLSGIATRPILTNQGWVGEDGTEALLSMGRNNAIVPLSNRRYVRPFARAVASEMGKVAQQPQQNVMNIYLDGRYLAGGVSENTTLGDLAKGLRRKARC